MGKIKRDAQALIKSVEMYPSRKVLIVEGIHDRLFIDHLIEDSNNQDVLILEIDSIDIDSVIQIEDTIENGNKGKIIALANIIGDNDNIKCFIDKDYSFLSDQKFPGCIITTDFIDLEAYLYEVKYMNKFLKVGLKTDKIKGSTLLSRISSMKYFGMLRMTSQINELKLSINKTNIRINKYIKIEGDFLVNILKEPYLVSVIQNSKDKIPANELAKLVNETSVKYKDLNIRDVAHGKDVLLLIGCFAQKLGLNKENIESVFWMSFDKNRLAEYENLTRVVGFLS